MSQSESSTDSTVTLHNGRVIDTMSLGVDEDDEEDEDINLGNVDGAVMLREEMELMIQRGSEALDCLNEMMAMMLQLHRTMKND